MSRLGAAQNPTLCPRRAGRDAHDQDCGFGDVLVNVRVGRAVRRPGTVERCRVHGERHGHDRQHTGRGGEPASDTGQEGADRTCCALFGLAHFTKTTATEPLLLISGSGSLGRVSCAGIGYVRDKDAAVGVDRVGLRLPKPAAGRSLGCRIQRGRHRRGNGRARQSRGNVRHSRSMSTRTFPPPSAPAPIRT